MNFRKDTIWAGIAAAILSATIALLLCSGCATTGQTTEATYGTYRDYLKPACEACGAVNKLQVHHSVPQHIILARLARGVITPTEAHRLINDDAASYYTLCPKCHLTIGHLNDFHRYNINVGETIKTLKEGPQE